MELLESSCVRPRQARWAGGFRFPFIFQLRPSLGKLSAARSIAFRVLLRASQALDAGSIPAARSRF
jgi:hypothetical protein